MHASGTMTIFLCVHAHHTPHAIDIAGTPSSSAESPAALRQQFDEDVTRLPESANTQNFAELFTGFLLFYAFEFNWLFVDGPVDNWVAQMCMDGDFETYCDRPKIIRMCDGWHVILMLGTLM